MTVALWAARVGAVAVMAGLSMAAPCGVGVSVVGVASADSDTGQVSTQPDRAHTTPRSARVPAAAPAKATRARPAAATRRDSTAATRRDLTAAPAAAARTSPASASAAARTAVALPAARPSVPALRRAATVAATSTPPATAAAAVAAASTVAGTVTPRATAAEPFPLIHGVITATDMFLTNTANWLYTLPTNPVTDILQGAVYLIRRSLFPSSVGVITAPIQVPLYFATIDDAGTQKVGIYVSLGGGTPQLFEFDTGGKGFYATYASGNPDFSPWWGDAVKTSTTTIQNVYDSGLTYKGYSATTTVSLFAAPGSAMPLLTTANATVGQIDSITDGSQTLWGQNGSTNAPVDGAFWGDFGMAPNYATNQVASLIGQLTFACGVLPGYRIHIDPVTQTAWMQVGLTAADTEDPAGLYFPMNLDPAAPQGATVPNSGLRYYGEQLFNAIVNIYDGGTQKVQSPLGITPDTGASTKLHNIPPADYPAYDQVVTWDNPPSRDAGKVKKDLDFFLTGTTVTGSPASFFGFTTTEKVNDGQVKVQNQRSLSPAYYLNTGISLFYMYDVVYYLGAPTGGGQLGLI